MRMLVCVMYDRKIDSFSTQAMSLMANDDLAKRAVHAAVLDENTEYSRYAGDFSLWHVGDFETDNGVLSPVERRKICEFDAFLTSRAYAVPQEG